MAPRFRSLVLAGLVMAAALPAQARVTGEVVEFGEMAVTDGGTRPPGPNDKVLSDIVEMVAGRYTTHADHVAAALCVTFGVTIKLDAAPGEGLPRQIEIHVRHPALTRPDGATSSEDILHGDVHAGSAAEAFTFSEPWEMQAGRWEFAFYAEGREVASQAFTVTLAPGPLRSVCEGPVS